MPQINKLKQIIKLPGKNLTTKTYTFVTISVFVIAVLVFFAIRPTVLTIFEINEKSKELSDSLDILVKKNKDLSDYKIKLDTLAPTGVKEQVDFFKAEVIPEKEDSLYVAANIDLIAKESNVSLTGFTPANLSDKQASDLKLNLPNNIRVKQVTINIDGKSINDVKSFITKLQGFARLNRVNSFFIRQNSSTDAKSSYSATIDFIMFYNQKLTAADNLVEN